MKLCIYSLKDVSANCSAHAYCARNSCMVTAHVTHKTKIQYGKLGKNK